jgi:hypothetical protein
MSKDKKDAIRRYVPKWSKNSTLIPTRDKKDKKDKKEKREFLSGISKGSDKVLEGARGFLSGISKGSDKVLEGAKKFAKGGLVRSGKPKIAKKGWR